MRISDWSSDVCSSDLARQLAPRDDDRGGDLLVDEQSVVFKILARGAACGAHALDHVLDNRRVHPAQSTVDLDVAIVMVGDEADQRIGAQQTAEAGLVRSEEHTSELQSLMSISYAGFCLKKK